jgi:hypothetical protein
VLFGAFFLTLRIPQVLIIGSFRAPKFNEQERQHVQIYMCVLRLANVKTDVVISINNANTIPTPNNNNSNDMNVEANNASEVVVSEQGIQEARDALLVMVNSFRVVDWSLFG